MSLNWSSTHYSQLMTHNFKGSAQHQLEDSDGISRAEPLASRLIFKSENFSLRYFSATD
jgi:hypothetical protein